MMHEQGHVATLMLQLNRLELDGISNVANGDPEQSSTASPLDGRWSVHSISRVVPVRTGIDVL